MFNLFFAYKSMELIKIKLNRLILRLIWFRFDLCLIYFLYTLLCKKKSMLGNVLLYTKLNEIESFKKNRICYEIQNTWKKFLVPIERGEKIIFPDQNRKFIKIGDLNKK